MMRAVIGRAVLGIVAAGLIVSATPGTVRALTGDTEPRDMAVVLAEDRCLGAPDPCRPVNGWQKKPGN
ncbi:hypothetical protein ABT154_25670 [Streptomyces sp. NPDC001728]|uniref:hypothetical protein n=1 Tax=Streptomyces sp. NPDC001728 TaxID=3154396 RepID=UPI0033287753